MERFTYASGTPLCSRTSVFPRRFGVIFLFLVVTVSRLGVGHARTASEAQVQCSAMCLSNYRSHATEEELKLLGVYPDRIMVQCSKQNTSNSDVCRTCLKACGFKMKPPSPSVCENECKEGRYQSTCLSACRFLYKLLTTNPGHCPRQAAGDSSTGVYRYPKCEEDRDCYRKATKCCPRGRQKACAKAEFNTTNVPPTPQTPIVLTNKNDDSKRKRIKHMTMVLDWSHYNLSAVEDPVIFIVQIRAYKGYQFDVSAVSRWIDLVMTSQRRAVLGDLKAGTWYQMRIAAISQRGMMSYSEPTKQQKLRDARRPSPPRDLREGVSRIHERKVDVQVRWEPPKRRDLPISKYEIMWREHYSFQWGEESSSSRFSASVPPTTSQFMIRDLKPSTMYKIEISAIVHYGNYQLRSKRVSLFITTTDIPTVPTPKDTSAKDLEATSSTYNESECLCGMPQTGGPLRVGLSFYEEGKLKVALHWNNDYKESEKAAVDSYILEWAPKVCVASAGLKSGLIFGKPFEATVDDSEVRFLSDLHFNCHYTLRVKGLTDTGQIALTWSTCFCTSSCLHTAVKRGSQRPRCPGESLTYIPQRPQNIRSRVWKMESGNDASSYSASIYWDSPTTQPKITSYSIVWGPRVYEPVDKSLYGRVLTPQLDLDQAESKVVQMSSNRHTIHNLQKGTLYIIRLKFISRSGDSPISTYYFRTPGRSRKEQSVEIVRHIVRPIGNTADCVRHVNFHFFLSLLLLFSIIDWT